MTLTPKLFVLEASGEGRLFSINPDSTDKTFLVTGCPVPDGVAVDATGKFLDTITIFLSQGDAQLAP